VSDQPGVEPNPPVEPQPDGDDRGGGPEQPAAEVEPAGLVRVTRSGGFAGLTMTGEVDLDQLDDPDRSIWRSALRAGFTPPGGHQPAPDRFLYRVHLEQTGLDVTVGDHELPDDLRTLLDRVVLPPT
jgi:hypothetical protein